MDPGDEFAFDEKLRRVLGASTRDSAVHCRDTPIVTVRVPVAPAPTGSVAPSCPTAPPAEPTVLSNHRAVMPAGGSDGTSRFAQVHTHSSARSGPSEVTEGAVSVVLLPWAMADASTPYEELMRVTVTTAREAAPAWVNV